MKKLEELKISPTPWIAKDILGHRVFNGEGFELCDSDSAFSAADARFIAVAPQLYDRAYRVLAECDRIMDHDGGMAVIRACSADRLECAMTELREALAEAAGEASDVK